MANSVRHQILERIKAALEGITITGGYYTDVKKVYTDAMAIDRVPKSNLPALFVFPGDESREWFALKAGSSYDIKGTLPVLIGGVLYAMTGVTQTQIENLILDSNKVLLNDVTLIGLCLSIDPGTIITDMDIAPNFATFEQTWTIQYVFDSASGG